MSIIYTLFWKVNILNRIAIYLKKKLKTSQNERLTIFHFLNSTHVFGKIMPVITPTVWVAPSLILVITFFGFCQFLRDYLCLDQISSFPIVTQTPFASIIFLPVSAHNGMRPFSASLFAILTRTEWVPAYSPHCPSDWRCLLSQEIESFPKLQTLNFVRNLQGLFLHEDERN